MTVKYQAINANLIRELRSASPLVQKPGHVYTGSSHGRNTAFSFSYSLGWGGRGGGVNIDAHSVSLSVSVHLELRRSLESEQAGRNSRQSSAVVPHLPPLGSPTQTSLRLRRHHSLTLCLSQSFFFFPPRQFIACTCFLSTFSQSHQMNYE